MSEEDLTVQHQPVETASFDLVNRVLTLPFWKDMSESMYDLFVGHEVGHALYTPTDKETLFSAQDRSNQSFVNIIEDARIEKLMKRKFAGLRSAMVSGYRDLLEIDFFGINDKTPEDINLIDRINLYFKCSAADNMVVSEWFNSEEMYFVDKISKVESFQDVSDIAAELYDYLKEKKEEQEDFSDPMYESVMSQIQDPESDMGTEDSEKESEKESSNESESTMEVEDGEQEESQSETNDMKSNDSGEEEPESQETTTASDDNSDTDADEDKSTPTMGAGSGSDEFESETEKNSQDAMEKFVEMETRGIKYVEFAKNIDYKKFVFDYKEVVKDLKLNLEYPFYKKNFYDEILKDNSKVVSYLVKEFEMKKSADMYAKAYTAKSGNINTSKLWSYQTSDDIFQRKNVVPEGKNHGMVLLMDWSGSMWDQLVDTAKQAVILAMFCRRVGIPFELYYFNDNGVVDYSPEHREITKFGEIITEKRLMLRNILSSRQTQSEFKESVDVFMTLARTLTNGYSYKGGIDSMGGTPLDDALLMTERLIGDFKKKNNLQKVNLVVLTDGESHENWRYSVGTTESSDGTIFNRLDSISTRDHVVFTDRSNNKIVEKPKYERITDCMLKYIGEKHDVNTIGFYLVKSRNSIKHAISTYLEDGYYKMKEFSQKLRKENYLVGGKSGYNEYFIVKVTEPKETELSVNSDMSRTKIASEFKKFNRSKKVNRQILNKFVEIVK